MYGTTLSNVKYQDLCATINVADKLVSLRVRGLSHFIIQIMHDLYNGQTCLVFSSWPDKYVEFLIMYQKLVESKST